MTFEVCGHETITVVNPNNFYARYYKGSGEHQFPNFYQSMFTQDSPTNCPIVGYIIETSGNNGTTFVDHPTTDPGRYVYLEADSATARMVVKTDRTMHNEFYITAYTAAGKFARQKFEIIVCDD